MIHFERLQLARRKEYDRFLHDAQRGCGYSFVNFYIWGRQRAAFVQGYLTVFSQFDRKAVYPFPVGQGELLPVLDNFDRALGNSAAVDAAWLAGIQLVHKQLMDTLAKLGLEEIDASGKFDPELHNAVMQDEAEDVESGMITEVFQKGYKVKNRIIRHSMVKVAK